MRLMLSSAVAVCVCLGASAEADVTMPSIFGDHMVVQRNTPLPVWGKADPGEKVTVSLADRQASTTAGDDGRWKLELEPVTEPGPHTMQVQGSNTLEFKDVLAGEVWICSGQSNMEWPVRASDNPQQEIAAANYPQIRLFEADKTIAREPGEDVVGTWRICSPESITDFSAVGYFFGRELHKTLNVPVGLIDTNWGGTPIEAWMAPQDLKSAVSENAVAAGLQRLSEYDPQLALPAPPAEDKGVTKPHWANPSYADAAWRKVTLPATIEGHGPDVDGAFWYRKRIQIPEALAGKAMTLSLGQIDDFDIVWFNGQEVGRTGADVPSAWQRLREYEVPADLVKAGENVIAVRVFDQRHGGGMIGPEDQMRLVPDGEGEPIALNGEWSSAFETPIAPDIDRRAQAERFAGAQNLPTALYNGMIAPLAPYAVRGFTWYQGESNTGNPKPYDDLLRGMIAGWRRDFAGPDETPQPFLIVQLANFQQRNPDPNVQDGWAEVREAQRAVSEESGNGLAVTIDIGDPGDIHPRNKQEVGRRLALQALDDVYDQEVQADGPVPTSATVRNGKVVVAFDHAQGLELRGDTQYAFAVAGEDGKFVWAEPAVEGNQVVLTAPGVQSPKTVRYAWQINPPSPLFNGADLPSGPFSIEVQTPQ